MIFNPRHHFVRPLVIATGLLILGSTVPPVQAGEGEIVILREVKPRVAYRDAGPNPVLARVATAPVDDLLQTLGLDGLASPGPSGGSAPVALADAQIAGVVGGMSRTTDGFSGPRGAVRHGEVASGGRGTATGQVTRAFGSLGGLVSGATSAAGTKVGQAAGAITGAIGLATMPLGTR